IVLRVGDEPAERDRPSFTVAKQLGVVAVEAVAYRLQITGRARGDLTIARVFARTHSRVFLVELVARFFRRPHRPPPSQSVLEVVQSIADGRDPRHQSPQWRPQGAE